MTTPDWQTEDGAIRLYCGDCRDYLDDLRGEVDCVVTDPPYGICVNHNMGRRRGDMPSSYGRVSWDDVPISRACCDALLKMSSEVVLWGANHFMDAIASPSPGWLVWDKLFSNDVSFAACELAYTTLPITVKKFTCSSARKNGVHPTQKPIELMEWCIAMTVGATVCDPFMGSGTTGVACVRLGRRFIGIEKERKYFDIAVKRITDELGKLRLFEPPLKIVQRSLLDDGE